MTDIDWSKAPEWANAVIASTDDSLYWVAQWGGKSARQLVGEQAISDHVADMNNPHKWRLLGTRPAPPWSGDGLPPVGTECEHKGNAPGNDDWTLVSILAHSKSMGQHVAVFQHGDHISYSSERYFRPIKTPAQIAAEEREAAIKAMWEIYWQPSATSAKQALGLLWDAGLRLPKGEDQ